MQSAGGSYAAAYVSILAPAQGASENRFMWEDNQIVSILAPAQGASPQRINAQEIANVSILAPAQGASIAPVSHVKSYVCFNSRPRTGGIRKNIQFFLLYLCRISKILFNNIDHILTMIHSTSIQSYIKQYFLREPPELTQMIPVRANSPNRIRT